MQCTTSASHCRTGFFAIIKFLLRLFSRTRHPRVCPSTHHHPQSTFPVKKPFPGILPTPSPHTNCSQYVDANVLCQTSRAFPDPRAQYLHLNLPAARLYVGRGQIFSPGSCWYTPQIGSQ